MFPPLSIQDILVLPFIYCTLRVTHKHLDEDYWALTRVVSKANIQRCSCPGHSATVWRRRSSVSGEEVTRSSHQSAGHVLSSQSQAHVICGNWKRCAVMLGMKVTCSQMGQAVNAVSTRWPLNQHTWHEGRRSLAPPFECNGAEERRCEREGLEHEGLCTWRILFLVTCHISLKVPACCGCQAGKYTLWVGDRLQSHRQPVGGSPAQDSLLQALRHPPVHSHRLFLLFFVWHFRFYFQFWVKIHLFCRFIAEIIQSGRPLTLKNWGLSVSALHFLIIRDHLRGKLMNERLQLLKQESNCGPGFRFEGKRSEKLELNKSEWTHGCFLPPVLLRPKKVPLLAAVRAMSSGLQGAP